MKQRIDGYYWVKVHKDNEWEISQWLCNSEFCAWIISDHEGEFDDEYFYKISEDPIQPPDPDE